jgi:hypothetical protein
MTFPHSNETGVESKRLDDQESVYRAGERGSRDSKSGDEATGAAIGGDEGTVDGQ